MWLLGTLAIPLLLSVGSPSQVAALDVAPPTPLDLTSAPDAGIARSISAFDIFNDNVYDFFAGEQTGQNFMTNIGLQWAFKTVGYLASHVLWRSVRGADVVTSDPNLDTIWKVLTTNGASPTNTALTILKFEISPGRLFSRVNQTERLPTNEQPAGRPCRLLIGREPDHVQCRAVEKRHL